MAGLIALLFVAVSRLERSLPPLPSLLRPSRPLIQAPRWWCSLAVVLLFAALLAPLASLVWKVGEAGTPRGWSAAHAWSQLSGEGWLLGGGVVRALVTAAATGMLVSAAALVCCWLAVRSAWLRGYLLVLGLAAWVAPGTVVGIGEQACVAALPSGPWLEVLYFAPSPVPLVWAHFIRFLPAALFFLWPVVRVLPRETLEAARLDGAGPLAELAFVVWPMTRRATGVIAIAVAALALGEHEAAGKVATPGWEAFTRLLFDRMHYGVDSNVAALSLLLLTGVAAAGLLALGLLALAIALLRSRLR
jgi:ABC-type Fe3+ transport system permease subunit